MFGQPFNMNNSFNTHDMFVSLSKLQNYDVNREHIKNNEEDKVTNNTKTKQFEHLQFELQQ